MCADGGYIKNSLSLNLLRCNAKLHHNDIIVLWYQAKVSLVRKLALNIS